MAEIDPFEAAMAQLQTGDGGKVAPPAGKKAKPADEPAAGGDPFEAALASLDDGDSAPADNAPDPVANALAIADPHLAAPSTAKHDDAHHVDINFLMDINLTVTFEVGRAKMYISDLLSLGQGSVIELHRLVGEDLEIFVNGHLLATGEVVVVNEKFGAKITKILNPHERVLRLGGVETA